MSPSTKPRASAFTLVELLAVIAIVGVLIAVVISVVGSVRKSANSSRCASNLRQIGIAFSGYAADHQNRYPLSFNESGRFDNSWWWHVAPYLGLKAPVDWPSLERACAPGGPLGCLESDSWISYKMTYAHRAWLINNGRLTTDANGVVQSGGIPVVNIRNPAQSLLVAEGRLHSEFRRWDTSQGGGFTLVYPHAGKANLLFADGHMVASSQQQCKDNWEVWYDRAVDN